MSPNIKNYSCCVGIEYASLSIVLAAPPLKYIYIFLPTDRIPLLKIKNLVLPIWHPEPHNSVYWMVMIKPQVTIDRGKYNNLILPNNLLTKLCTVALCWESSKVTFYILCPCPPIHCVFFHSHPKSLPAASFRLIHILTH